MSRNKRKTNAAPAAASMPNLAKVKRDRKASSKPKGRAGVKNHDYAASESTPSSCPKCGSTERVPYYRKHEHEVTVDPKGKPATHVVMRYTKCSACGQHRIDRAFENRKSKRGENRPAA